MAKEKKNPFAAQLKKAQKNFDSANTAGGFVNKNVEDGKQEFRLIKADLVSVASGTKLMVEWTCEFEVDKKLLKKNKEAGIIKARDGIETEQNMSFLKRKLDMFGYDTSELNLAQDLCQILEEISKKKMVIEGVVKTSADEQFQNVMFNRVVDEGDSAEDDDDDDDASEDEDEEEEDEEEDADEDEEDEDEDEEDEDEDADEPDMKKGDFVMFKPPRARKALKCKITLLKNGKADLKDEAGGIHKGILLEKLEAVDDADADDEDADEDEGDDESSFGEIEKGSKLEVKVKGKGYKAVAVAEPNDRNETIKVKFSNGPLKGQVKNVDQSDCELLD
jgi:hypothetical protein